MNLQQQTLPKSVRRISVVTAPNRIGANNAVVYVKGGGKKRKHSPGARPFERMTRRIAAAQIKGLSEYLKRHNASASKKKNGWFKDLRKNLRKSRRKALDSL